AGLSLPPRIDNRAAIVANHVVVPLPRLRIDWLADRTEKAKRLARRFLDRIVATLHQRADSGWCGVDDVDLVLAAHFPKARGGRIVRDTFEHHRDGTVGKRAVDDVAVAGHPADVSGAPVDVALVIVEYVLVCHRRVNQVAGGRVQYALRL